MAAFNRKINGVALSLSLLLLRTAHAQSGDTTADTAADDACTRDSACNRHYELAREHSKAGRADDALIQYQAAYYLQAVPTLLFNMARMQHKLERLPEAASAYQRYLLQSGPTEEPQRAKAQAYLQALALVPSVATALPSLPAVAAQLPPPIHKRWWFWTTLGMVVLGGISAAALGSQLDPRSRPPEVLDLRGRF